MTTPTVNLGMSHIQTEFGGSNPIAISEYYSAHANVATSGLIKMSQFLGITVVYVDVIARSPNKSGTTSPQNAYAVFASTGGYTQVPPNDYTWLKWGTNSDFQIRYQRSAGTETAFNQGGLANDTWYGLGTTRTMALSVSVVDTFRSLTANVQISWAANSTIIDYAICDWYAERTIA